MDDIYLQDASNPSPDPMGLDPDQVSAVNAEKG